MKVLICADMFPAMIETVKRRLPEDDVRACVPEEVPAQAPWAEVLIPAMTRLTSAIIQSAPDLKLIQQFGVGLEGVALTPLKTWPLSKRILLGGVKSIA